MGVQWAGRLGSLRGCEDEDHDKWPVHKAHWKKSDLLVEADLAVAAREREITAHTWWRRVATLGAALSTPAQPLRSRSMSSMCPHPYPPPIKFLHLVCLLREQTSTPAMGQHEPEAY